MATYGINLITGEPYFVLDGTDIDSLSQVFASINHIHEQYLSEDDFNNLITSLQEAIVNLQVTVGQQEDSINATQYANNVNATNIQNLTNSLQNLETIVSALLPQPEISSNVSYLTNKKTGITAIVNTSGVPANVVLQYDSDSNFSNPTNLNYGSTPNSGYNIIPFIIPRQKPGTYYYKIILSNEAMNVESSVQMYTIYTGVGREQTDYSQTLDNERATYTGTTYYIDPTALVNGNGLSPETPYNNWSSVGNLSGNRNYLQKAGTTALLLGGFNGITGNCRIGTYGGTAKAKLSRPVDVTYFIESRYKLMIENFEIEGTYKNSINQQFTGVGLRLRNSSGSIIYNCDFHGFGQGITFNPINGVNGASWSNVKVLYCTIYDIATDGIYADDVTGVEIGHCYIYDVNQMYFYNTDDGVSAGDGIQFAFAEVSGGDYLRFDVHHCTIDRRSTGNKFCLIWGAGNIQMKAEVSIRYNEFLINGLNENCIYSDLIYLGENSIEYNLFSSSSGTGVGFFNRVQSNAIVNNNIFENLSYGVANSGAAFAEIQKNTFINCSNAFGVEPSTEEVHFIYNIVKSNNPAHRLFTGTNYIAVSSCNFNCYNLQTILNAAPNLTDLRTLLGKDTDSIDEDADLNEGYELNPTSPCILEGDYIGAVEFISSGR